MRVLLTCVVIIVSGGIALTAHAQSAEKLRARYGSPLEAFEVRPHVLMTVKSSEDGWAYEYVIEARHKSRDKMDAESLMSARTVKDILTEVAPESSRGSHRRSTTFNSGCNELSVATYERVEIRTFSTCPSVAGNSIASVVIRWIDKDR